MPRCWSATSSAFAATPWSARPVAIGHSDGGTRIAGLACAGLGTGVGAMTGEEAAAQMRAAHDMIVLQGWRRLLHPMQAPFALGSQYRPPRGES